MRKYYYFIVEGVHDTAALRRFFKRLGLKSESQVGQVDSFWERTIPTFPHNGDLQKRVPVPSYFQNERISIAVQNAGGETKILDAFDTLLNIDYDELAGIAIFCDADQKKAKEKFDGLLEHLIGNIDKEFLELVKDTKFDEVKSIPKKFGIFVFPNNEDSGTLELLLLEGGELVYADLLVGARSYLEGVSEIHKRKWTVSDADKVLFGVVANVLKPGKANQVSIQDNHWISNQTIESTSQIRLLKFLEGIFR